MENPLNYWDVNVNGTIMTKTMFKNNCNEFIFSVGYLWELSFWIDK